MEPGDIVQITDENHHWYPCLLIVSDVRIHWGGIGCFLWYPRDNMGNIHKAAIRINPEQVEYVGKAALVPDGLG